MPENSLIFAYIRVSTKEQNAERQLVALKEYEVANNIKIDRIFIDKASGRNFNRPEWIKLKNVLRKGDTLIVKELDRLGRNTQEIKNEWAELKAQGVKIVIINMPLLSKIDSGDAESNLIQSIVFELLAYMAEKENEVRRARQAEGIAAAKKRGVYQGRPRKKPDNFIDIYPLWKNKKITATQACKALNVSRPTFYKLVKELEK